MVLKNILMFLLLFNNWPNSIKKFSLFEKEIRDYGPRKSKEEASSYLKSLMEELEKETKEYCIEAKIDSEFCWPVKNYSRRDVGEGGFIAKDYDWFDGNEHKGHPAYDIFVHDKNQDCIDDITLKPIEILAVTDAVVVSINKGWKKGSEIRGGNYIYLYNPYLNLFFYYAHLDSIFVEEGQCVKKGETIATLGRTGKNAIKKRSPTHLHFSILKYKNGKLIPIDWLNRFKFKYTKE
jgi:murein DD-endopeptidase MepM/ murein hydrolase activator NlpD